MRAYKVFEKISVFGLGYIGLPTAAMFASRRVKVVGVDVRQSVVDKINRGEIHIVEPDLDIAVHAAVTEGYLSATMTPEPADAFIIAVPTPLSDSLDPDLTYVEAAAKAIAPVLRPGNLVVLESTSPVGATEKLAEWLAEARADLTFPQTHGDSSDVLIAYCPERVLPGKVMQELITNDRIVGGLTKRSADQAVKLYEVFVKGECFVTDTRTAEMTKLTENSFRDVNIAFANELSLICDRLQINVWELIRLANRHPRVNILQPGSGVGGHCIAVDPWFIVASAPEEARLIKSARTVNDDKPRWVIEKVEEAISAYLGETPGKSRKDVTVACYGLAFKPDIDDLRESPALDIVSMLAGKPAGGSLLAVEPNIDEIPAKLSGVELVSLADALARADIHVLLVDHKQFKETTAPQRGKIVDVRGVWS